MRVLPVDVALRVAQRKGEPRHRDEKALAAVPPYEGAEPSRRRSLGLDLLVIARREQRRVLGAQGQRLPDQEQLLAAIAPAPREFGRRRAGAELLEPAAARVPIDGAAVVGVDHAEVPELAAL